jgi:hypothetical protein
MMCLSQNGTVSKHRRKQYKYSVQEEVFDYIEQVTQTMLRDQKEEKEGTKIADL